MTGTGIRRAATVVWPDGTETELRLTEAQRDGRACIRCASLTLHAAPVGLINGAGQVFACAPSCDPSRSPSTEDVDGTCVPARAFPPGPGPANLSGGPRVLGPGRVGTQHVDRPLVRLGVRRPPVTLTGLIAGWVVDRVAGLFTHSVSFAGPLTAPGATAPASVPEPDPRPALLGHENPPAGGPARNPQTNDVLIDGSERSEPLPRSIVIECTGPNPDTGLARIAAWDCLFGTVDGHRCLAKYGQPVKPGGSCHASVQLISQTGFDRHYPTLHARALALRIIESDPAVA